MVQKNTSLTGISCDNSEIIFNPTKKSVGGEQKKFFNNLIVNWKNNINNLCER